MEQRKPNHDRRVGRSRKEERERKTQTVSIRFSQTDYEKIKDSASLAGQKLSAYAQAILLKGKIVERFKKEDMETLRILSGEANNLNQLTRIAHQTGLKNWEDELQNLVCFFSKTLKKLFDDWKN